MAKKTYDPKRVLVSIGGNLLGGFAEDMIEIEADEDMFSKMVGGQGDVTRTKNNNAGAKITIRLLQDSSSNDVLSALMQADKLTNEGVSPFQMQELNGTTLITAGNCWVSKWPNIKRAKAADVVEWVLDCESAEIFVGGLIF